MTNDKLKAIEARVADGFTHVGDNRILLARITELEAENKRILGSHDAYADKYEDELLDRKSAEALADDLENQIAELTLGMDDAEAALADLRERKDGAYEERNRVVAALARLFPSGVTKTDIPGWDAEWHGCVYIDTPAGQLSWHFHDSQARLFESLPAYEGEWDGHTTEEKYERLAALDGKEPTP